MALVAWPVGPLRTHLPLFLRCIPCLLLCERISLVSPQFIASSISVWFLEKQMCSFKQSFWTTKFTGECFLPPGRKGQDLMFAPLWSSFFWLAWTVALCVHWLVETPCSINCVYILQDPLSFREESVMSKSLLDGTRKNLSVGTHVKRILQNHRIF